MATIENTITAKKVCSVSVQKHSIAAYMKIFNQIRLVYSLGDPNEPLLRAASVFGILLLAKKDPVGN